MNNRILVIDDDESILDAIRYALEYSGYEVTTSEKGEYAEKLLSTTSELPKLIILDVLLSGKDGRTICKKLKADKKTKKIPIIMISAHPGADRSVKEVGADEFIAKPFDVDVLIDRVKKYITL
jgi:DNA-binding response OmpR family regulator